jgi:hypothetical protein
MVGGLDVKTPEQIALSLTATHAENDFAINALFKVRALMADAIEADRAERQARLDDLHAYDWNATEHGDDEVDGDAETILIVEIDTPHNIGRMRVYINDGRIYDGDPETGQTWSLT